MTGESFRQCRAQTDSISQAVIAKGRSKKWIFPYESKCSDWQRKFVSTTTATSTRTGVGYMPCQGLYYSPSGRMPKTALIASHYNVEFSEHYRRSKRGKFWPTGN